ncbi:MAG: GGDEF and EAL domain-containing protein, partial [Blautia sp.]|nr:GGDEF and EAL domain-containing protein [Blautia sp.]
MKDEFYQTNTGGNIPTGLPGGFFIYEADNDEERILFAETNVIRIYGCESFEEFLDFVGGSFHGMVHPEDIIKIQSQIHAQTSISQMRHDYVRYRILTKQGEVRYIEDFGHILHSKNGMSYFYVFIVDVDQNEFYNRSRNSLAEAEILAANHDIDELTGLFNMSLFYQRVQLSLSSPEGRRRNYAIVHFDFPNFKLYNERLGFAMGDEMLRYFAEKLRKVFAGGTVARFSDDHFVVCDSGAKEEIINRVEELYKTILRSEDVNKKVRFKAGIYFLDNRRAEVGLACDHARLACNSIKRRHDVFYCVYDEMMRDRMRRQQYVVDNIDKAIEQEYIKVFYQPVVRVKTGKICGYEALVRWVDSTFGMLSPADFIDTLEQYQLINLVDEYVVRKVCEDYTELVKAGEQAVPVSVNISRLDFDLCDIVSIIENTCREYNVPRNMLDIEITESALNDNVGHIRAECNRLRQMGYEIWLDDFGSGYSSLNSLAEYEFDVLKMDLVFLRSRETNRKSGVLMTYIIEGTRGMGLEPLCEGVETEEQFEF